MDFIFSYEINVESQFSNETQLVHFLIRFKENCITRALVSEDL